MEPIEKPNLTEEILNRIITMISSNEVKLGDKLPPERLIAESLNVGRSSVREALKVLKILGILEVKVGGGTYVKSDGLSLIDNSIKWGLLLNKDWERDLMQLRYVNEPHFVYLACQNRTKHDLDNLEVIVNNYYNSDTAKKASVHDMEFHLKISEMTKNLIFRNIMSATQELLATYIEESLLKEKIDTIEAIRRNDHRDLFLAIMEKNSEQAKRIMIKHLQRNNRIWGYNFDNKLKLI